MNVIGKIRSLLNKLIHKQMDANEFTKTLEDLFITLEKGSCEIIAETMLDLWDAIVDNTPVDLGVAASNWQIGSSYNNDIINHDILKQKIEGKFHLYSGRQVPRPKRPDSSKFFKSDKIVIFNNTPYIDELEHGSSPQSPPGHMVADNKQYYKKLMEDRLKETGMFT